MNIRQSKMCATVLSGMVLLTLLLVLQIPAMSDYIVEDGLIGYWSFDADTIKG